MYSDGKSGQVYRRLKADIQSGVRKSGERFPPEIELAAELGVARKTLRAALSELECEKLIVRKRKNGTFVRENNDGIISLCIAFPGYLREFEFGYHSQLLFEGLMEASFEHNNRVETIAVSKINDNKHMDFQQLEHLGGQSMVVMESSWYIPLFPLLKARGCRALHINSRNFRRLGRYLENSATVADVETTLLPDSWSVISLDMVDAFRRAVLYLHECGARRIAMAALFLQVKEHSFWDGYRAGLREIGQADEIALNLSREMPLPEQLKSFYQREKFDGLVLLPSNNHCPTHLNFTAEMLGLPARLPVVGVQNVPLATWEAPQIPILEFAHRQLGLLAAELITAPEPAERIVKAQWRWPAHSSAAGQ